MSDALKIGLAGAGVFGSYHAAKIASHSKAALHGVFDLDTDRAVFLAEKYGSSCFECYDELLNACDAVVVAAPASVHFELAEAALLAGKHLFVEKPIALTAKEADHLTSLACDKSLSLQVGHQERYVSKAIGLFDFDNAPKAIKCIRQVPNSGRCDDVSVVFDLMIHDIDIVRQISGSDFVAINANGSADEAEVKLVLANGVSVYLEAGRCASNPERRIELEFDNGKVVADFLNRTIEDSTPTGQNRSFAEASESSVALDDPLAFGAELFVQSILEGAADGVSGGSAGAAVQWAEAIEALIEDEVGGAEGAKQRLRA